MHVAQLVQELNDDEEQGPGGSVHTLPSRHEGLNVQPRPRQGQDAEFTLQNPLEVEAMKLPENHVPPAEKQDAQLEHLLKLEEEQELEHLTLVARLQSQPNDQLSSPEHVVSTIVHVPEVALLDKEVHFPPTEKHSVQV